MSDVMYVIWTPYDWLNKFYNVYIIIAAMERFHIFTRLIYAAPVWPKLVAWGILRVLRNAPNDIYNYVLKI